VLTLGLIACADVLIIAGALAALALLAFVILCMLLTHKLARLLASERLRVNQLETDLQDRLAQLRREHEHNRELVQRERRALSHRLAQAQGAATDHQHTLAQLNRRTREQTSAHTQSLKGCGVSKLASGLQTADFAVRAPSSGALRGHLFKAIARRDDGLLRPEGSR
jgi:methyl-accepting chemotaxis protein